MEEAMIKGGFIIRALEYVVRKQGQDVLKEFSKPPEFYQEEHWYPFEDFCECLVRIEEIFADDRKDNLFLVGKDTIKRDDRWNTMFKGQDPKQVFGVNTRQNDQVKIGDFQIEENKDGYIRIRMELWSGDFEQTRLWSHFYTGCSQTILDLTGRKGYVSQRPDPDNRAVVYFELHWK
jgi:hypothetical protein